jgi:hypothetical protein
VTALLAEQVRPGETVGPIAAGGKLDVEPFGERLVGVPGPDGFERVREIVGQLADDAQLGQPFCVSAWNIASFFRPRETWISSKTSSWKWAVQRVSLRRRFLILAKASSIGL